MSTIINKHYNHSSRPGTAARRLTSNVSSSERDRERDREGDRDRDRDSFSRWRDRQYFGPRRWLESALRDSSAWERDQGIFTNFWITSGVECDPVFIKFIVLL